MASDSTKGVASGAVFPRLRLLPFSLKLAVAGVVLALAIGEAAALEHVVQHHENRDEQKGLSFVDLQAAYHGATISSPLRRALEGDHGRLHLPDAKQRAALLQWLAGDQIAQAYDDEDRLGDLTPALLLEQRCVGCHDRNPKDPAGAAGVAPTLPLATLPDVQKLAFSHELAPADEKILVQSTHAHALTLPLVGLAAAVLLLLSSWPRRLVHALAAFGSIGLVVDLASWWLARPDFLPTLLPFGRGGFVWGVALGGAAYSLALAAALLLVLVDLFLPAKLRSERADD